MREKNKYQFFWREHGVCYFVADLILRGYYVEEGITLYEKPAGEGYISKKGLVEAGKIGLKLCRNRAKIKQVISNAKKIAPRARRGFEYFKKANLRKKSDKELFLLLEKYISDFISVVKLYFSTEPHFFYSIEKILRDYLSKKIRNKKKLNQYFATLVLPSISTLFNQGKSDWLNVIIRTSRNRLKLSRERDLMENELDLPSEIKNIAASVRDLGLMRLNLDPYLRFGLEISTKLLIEIAKRKQYSPDQVGAMSYREIKDVLLYNKRPLLEKLNQKKEKFAILHKRKRIKVFIGKEADRYFKLVKPSVPVEKLREFKGKIANPGYVKGKARVLRNIEGDLSAQVKKMKKGEILVTEMTRPQIILAVRKAIAIVTDEGGINSHASIISRELDKPCVIDTKHATLIIKTGDLVEIDANKGVVKILKKAS